MDLWRYHDEERSLSSWHQSFRTAVVYKEGTKWMRVLVIDGGRLKMLRRPLSDRKHMARMATNERKAKATFRRLARLKGTSREIRKAVLGI